MPTKVEPSSQDFSKVVKDASDAITALTKGLSQENQVFLSFCETMVSDTLSAMSQMSKLDLTIAKEGAAKAQKSVAKATKAAVETAEASKKAMAKAEKDAVTVQDGPSQQAPSDELARIFIQGVNNSMMNAVNAQQQLYVTAQAATTQTISTIIALTTASVAVAVKNIEEK